MKRSGIQQTTQEKQPKHRSTCCNNKMLKPRDTSKLESVFIHASAYNFVLMRQSDLWVKGKGMKAMLNILPYLFLSVNQMERGQRYFTSYSDHGWNSRLKTGIEDLAFSERIVKQENLPTVRLNKEPN